MAPPSAMPAFKSQTAFQAGRDELYPVGHAALTTRETSALDLRSFGKVKMIRLVKMWSIER